MKAEQLSSLSTERLLDKKSELLQAARPYMQVLSAAAESDRHATMLADEMAVVLDVIADPTTTQSSNNFPGTSNIQQEALSGANGIDTPPAAACLC
jgi:transcriptional regulator of acetoin/glycerol metabolism